MLVKGDPFAPQGLTFDTRRYPPPTATFTERERKEWERWWTHVRAVVRETTRDLGAKPTSYSKWENDGFQSRCWLWHRGDNVYLVLVQF